VHGEDVAMDVRALRRTRPAIARLAEIGTHFERACRHLTGRRVTGTEVERGNRRWDVDDDPMPEAAAGRGIGIEAGHGETLGAFRHAAPGQLGREITAGAAKAVGFGQHVLARENIAFLEAGAGQSQGHRRFSSCRARRGQPRGGTFNGAPRRMHPCR